MEFSAYRLARRFLGVKELAGVKDNPQILAWLRLDAPTATYADEVPWCSAFLNWVAWVLDLPRSRSLAARSWLNVGTPIRLEDAIDASRKDGGNDVVIFKRGPAPQPGPDVLEAPGHVGIFAALDGAFVIVIGGNQGNAVSIGRFPVEDVLGVRRLT